MISASLQQRKTRTRRSMLFVPGANAAMVSNSFIYPADALMFDLEDSVALREKDTARRMVYHALQHPLYHDIETIVRVNALDSEWGVNDLEAVVRGGADVVRLPKTDTAQDVLDIEKEILRIEKACGREPGSTGLLAAIESLLSASVADGMTGGRHKPNMELIAQGIGNIGSALFGGIPATGAIARTATNIKAGAKSPVSGMIHAVTLLAILMAFAQYAQQIPLAVLAGILTVVCYNMSEMHTFSRLLKGPRQDAAVLVITFLLTVFVDLVVAVEVGVVLAALLFMGRMAQISDVSAIKNELLDNDEEDDEDRSTAKLSIPEGVEVFDVKGPFFFGAVEQFKDQVLETLEIRAAIEQIDLNT